MPDQAPSQARPSLLPRCASLFLLHLVAAWPRIVCVLLGDEKESTGPPGSLGSHMTVKSLALSRWLNYLRLVFLEGHENAKQLPFSILPRRAEAVTGKLIKCAAEQYSMQRVTGCRLAGGEHRLPGRRGAQGWNARLWKPARRRWRPRHAPSPLESFGSRRDNTLLLHHTPSILT